MTDQELDAPWRPPGVREFVVGDRVRVRLSGECRTEGERGSTAYRLGIIGHKQQEDGKVGLILGVGECTGSHPYRVHVRNAIEISGEFFCCFSYAFSELELVEAARA